MKKSILPYVLLNFICCGIVQTQGFAQGTWTQKTSLAGVARTNAVSFSVGNKAYITTGSNGSGTLLNDLWEYDVATNSWSQKANFPGTGRQDAVGLSIGNYGYIGMGFSIAGNFTDFWQYDPSANSWTQKANISSVYQRYGCFGFSINGKGYVGSGYSTSGGYLTEFKMYDPATNTWSLKFSVIFAGGRAFSVGFAIGNYGYMSTGYDGNLKTDLWQYDPVADSWTQKANFPGVARENAVAFTIGNYGYVGSGWRFISPSSQNDFYRYNPVSNTWSNATTFPAGGRMFATATSVGSKAYFGTGLRDTVTVIQNDWWSFDAGSVGLDNIESTHFSLNVYPNPFSTETTVETDSRINNGSIIIYDMKGSVVERIALSNRHSCKLKQNNKVKGLYKVALLDEFGKTVAIKKILIN